MRNSADIDLGELEARVKQAAKRIAAKIRAAGPHRSARPHTVLDEIVENAQKVIAGITAARSISIEDPRVDQLTRDLDLIQGSLRTAADRLTALASKT
jgi:hypothetical protein